MTPYPSALARLLALLAVLVVAASCASLGTTRPNVSILDRDLPGLSSPNLIEARSILSYVEGRNRLLAAELGKLPELQDGIDARDIAALRHIRRLYRESPRTIDAIFAEMYTVGIPTVRRYCSPLQAFFWLAEDDRIVADNKGGLLIELPLPYTTYVWTPNTDARLQLLSLAWDTSDREVYRKVQIDAAIAALLDPAERERYSAMAQRLDPLKVQKYLFDDFQNHPHMFSPAGRTLFEAAAKGSQWRDFETVTDRLNAPALVGWWLNKHFRYAERDKPQPAEVTFATHHGDSKAYAIFSYHCLARAGYEPFLFTMDPKSPFPHTVCAYREDSRYFTLDNKKGGKAGPFESTAAISEAFGLAGKEAYIETPSQMNARFDRD